MDAEIKRLAELLEAAQALLSSHGETRWSAWLAQDAKRVRDLDLYGIEHFLSAFGTMGSINDLVLHPMNGHRIREDEVDRANTLYRELLWEAHDLAKKLYGEEANARRSA